MSTYLQLTVAAMAAAVCCMLHALMLTIMMLNAHQTTLQRTVS
jgi:hypothetical protein